MSIANDLRGLGIEGGRCALFHTSMKAIGPYPGGAEALLADLADYFAPGLLALPALSYTLAAEEKRLFDPAVTPACIGLLPNVFLRQPGVRRSVHPTHSVAAVGADAEAFLAGQEYTDSPCAWASPWGEICRREGVIVLAGCGLTRCTYLHGVEEWTLPGSHLGQPIDYTLRMPDGSLMAMKSRPHSGMPSEQFWKVESHLEDGGALRRGRLGNAPALAVDAALSRKIVASLLLADPHLFDDPQP